MATKLETKNTQTDDKRVKPIILKDDSNGDIFVLEFNRDTVKYAEARGFKIGAFDEGQVITTTEELFFYAFRMHHPNKSKADTDKILYEKLHGLPTGMLDRLIDLYVLPVTELRQNEEESKNSTMTAEF